MCGNRLTAAKGKKKDAVYKCRDYAANLQAAFHINVIEDVPGIHPSSFCSCCKHVLDKIICAQHNEVPFRSTLEEFQWVTHTEEGCRV